MYNLSFRCVSTSLPQHQSLSQINYVDNSVILQLNVSNVFLFSLIINSLNRINALLPL